MRYTPYRWALPPLSDRAGRAERRWHTSAETQAKSEIRWVWNEVCSGTHMIRRMVPTGTASWEPPRIGRVSLGPPTTFTVELRPGQLIDDLLAIGDRLAAAFGVDDVEVLKLPASWIRVVLVETEGVGHERTRHVPARPGPGTHRPDTTGADQLAHSVPEPRERP